jgi:tetratricopeptide (TPR) repeat protein
MVAYDSQHFEEALALHQQSVERLERTLGPDSPRLASPRMFLGLVLHRLGRQADARRHLSRALELWERSQGADGAMAANALRPLARVELATSAPRAALGHCERALALDEKAQGADAPDVALDLACLAEAHLALAAPAQAVPLLERAGRIHARSPRDPLDAAWATFLLARALGEQGQGPHRSRAAVLAEESRGRLEALGVRARWELREVTGWLARYPAPTSLVRHEVTP